MYQTVRKGELHGHPLSGSFTPESLRDFAEDAMAAGADRVRLSEHWESGQHYLHFEVVISE